VAVFRRLEGGGPDVDVMGLLALDDLVVPVALWILERGVHADAVRRLL
jgi:hypothetical protein